ncbi:MAG TPA: hypothetical protein VER32_07375 [Pyrinomonadaceae bacterium]|nr:hypothetical protein [Pyrinomonadaceae bacterium]
MPRRGSLRRRVLLAALVVAASVAAWVAHDLYAPRRTELRRFDPDEVARLETEMWRSYYARERVRLFRQLSELLRTQYRLPLWRSNRVAYHAARAAFVFKDGRSRADYERALPDLRAFYTSIRDVSDVEFDVERASRLELEWWIVHRERARRPPEDLTRTLAELAAELYRVPPEKLSEHARLRADAMKVRDEAAARGGVSEQDWQRIGDLLRRSWQSLHRAVN